MKVLHRIAFAAAALLFGSALSANAETVKFIAELKGASEVPPTDSQGAGKLSATYDTATKVFTYTIEHMKLSGEPTAAHFHGPAAIGENAGPALPIPAPLTSPIKATATLNDKQAADLMAEKWYVNIHTAKHGPGEIRGQVTKQIEQSGTAKPMQ
jgi:hypothetical protein